SPRARPLDSRALTSSALWAQHNEHRPLFPITVLLGLARLTRWNTKWEIVLTVAVGAAIFAMHCTYLRSAWRTHGGVPVWLAPVFSVLLFSPLQWENWLWGWQITVLLCALAMVVAAYLAAGGARGLRLSGMLGCGLVATFSFAAGLVVWPVHAVV